MNIVPGFSSIEKFIKRYTIVFSLIVIYQGLFGGMSLKDQPSRLKKISKNVAFKIFTMSCIAFTATQDIEISLISVVLFITLLYLVRTPAERKKSKNPLDF
jgi:hypothetical protein